MFDSILKLVLQYTHLFVNLAFLYVCFEMCRAGWGEVQRVRRMREATHDMGCR